MYSIKKKRSPKNVIFLAALAFFILVIVGGGLYVRNDYIHSLQPVSADTNVVVVTIRSGSSVKEVGQLLVQKKLIRKSWPFEWYVRTHNIRDKLQAGSYLFSQSMSTEVMINKITGGKIATDLFTILPAQRIDQMTQPDLVT